MFDLADAMAKAYQEAIVKKNPRKGAKKTLNILDEDDNVSESIEAQYLGKGAFSNVWWDGDKRVIIILDEDKCGEMTKAMLADLNARDGEQPFVPVVHAIGWLPKPRGGGFFRVYESVLYKTPLRKSDSPQAWAMAKVLIKVIENAKDVTFSMSDIKWSIDCRYRVATEMEGLDEEPPAGVDEATWKLFCETVAYLCRESVNYSNMWLMEASPRNLATDANGQLILLDIFFDLSALKKIRSGKC